MRNISISEGIINTISSDDWDPKRFSAKPIPKLVNLFRKQRYVDDAQRMLDQGNNYNVFIEHISTESTLVYDIDGLPRQQPSDWHAASDLRTEKGTHSLFNYIMKML